VTSRRLSTDPIPGMSRMTGATSAAQSSQTRRSGRTRASTQSLASATVVNGVCSAGFRTTVLPQRGREFPGSDHEREVPWRNQGAHADRLTSGVVHGPRDRHRRRLALDLRAPAGVVAEHVRRHAQADHLGHAERLALIERFQARQLVRVRLDQIGDLPQQPSAGGRNYLVPCRVGEGLPGAATAASTSA